MNEFLNPAAKLVAGFDGEILKVIIICAVFISEIFGPLCLKYALMKSGEGTEPPRKPSKRQLAALAAQGAADSANQSSDSTNSEK